MENISLNGRLVGPDQPPYIIAEIGANHNGDMQLCRELIDAAKECGADAVKFQSWTKNSLLTRDVYEENEGLEEVVLRYQLTPEQHHEAASYCHEKDIHFLSTGFTRSEIDLLDELESVALKIASMDINHLPLLQYAASKKRPIILSTGMATLGEIETGLATLREHNSGPVALLHCVSIYPPKAEDIHLRNIDTLRTAFDAPVGFSDHSIGVAIPLAAIARGAVIIEKHFTLDKKMEGWDHAVSATPDELAVIVQEGRNVHVALGSAVRRVSEGEMEKRKAFRRHVVAARELRQGDVLRLEDFEYKRPGEGVAPSEAQYLIGRRLTRDVAGDESIGWADVA